MIVPTSAVLTPASAGAGAGAGSYGLPALMAVQAVTGAYSSWQQGKAQRYISKANARISEMQARDALKRGHEAEGISRQKTKKLIGSQRAALAAQGIRVDYGSAQDIQQEAQDIGELDALTIKNNAAREAFGFMQEASNSSMQGRLASSMANTKAMDTLLSGGIQAYGAYKQYGWKGGK